VIGSILQRSLLGAGIILAALGMLFTSWSISERRLPFNTQGRYFDGDVVHLQQDNLGLAILAVTFFAMAAVALGSWDHLRRKRARKSRG
jgi:hypothetical protein